MSKTTGTTPPTRCTLCAAWAVKKPEPDGVARCFGHSLDPVNVAKRDANAAKGTAVAERNRGIAQDQRGAVLAGVVPIEQARAEKAKTDARAELKPVPLGSKADVLAFLGSEAAVLRADGEASRASAASAIARVALAALGIEDKDPDEEDAPPRGFTYRTTTGEVVAVRGRDGPVH